MPTHEKHEKQNEINYETYDANDASVFFAFNQVATVTSDTFPKKETQDDASQNLNYLSIKNMKIIHFPFKLCLSKS